MRNDETVLLLTSLLEETGNNNPLLKVEDDIGNLYKEAISNAINKFELFSDPEE